MRDKKVIFMCNNKVVVYIINKEILKDKLIRCLFICLLLFILLYNIYFYVKHILGNIM